jgi:PhnB protein
METTRQETVTPYLTVRDPERLLAFVREAFGAVELFRGTGSAGGLHAEVRVGDSKLMIGGMPGLPQEFPAAPTEKGKDR